MLDLQISNLKHDTCHVSICYVLRQMGAIFVTKCSLTLQTDMLGTPEILWEHDQFDAHIPQVNQQRMLMNDELEECQGVKIF